MQLPILRDHDCEKPIGWVSVKENRLHFRLSEENALTKEELFELFGNAGIQATAFRMVGDTMLFVEGEILEFSLAPVKAEERKPT